MGARSGWTWIEELRALPENDPDVGDGASRREVRIMPRSPTEIVHADFLPTAVFGKSVLRTNEVKVRNHAAGKRFVEPHLVFIRTLRDVAPSRSARRVGGGYVGSYLAIQDRIANTALQAASPNGCVVIGTALIISLKPCGNFAHTIKIRSAAYVASQVGKEEAVVPFLLGDGIVFLPQFQRAVGEDAPICRRTGRGELPTDGAMANRQAAQRRPAIGVETVHIVK